MTSARKIQSGLGLFVLHVASGSGTNYLRVPLEFHLGLYGRHDGEPERNQLHRKFLDSGPKPRH